MFATRTEPLNAAEARDLILTGSAPDGLEVKGTLELKGAEGVTRLPAGLKARRLRLVECPDLETLPEGLRVRHLEIKDCPRLTTLPAGLHCYEIDAPASSLVGLPDGLRVDFRFDLRNSEQLTRLSAGLKVGSLVLRGCTALEQLPEGLDVCFLDLQGCRRLRHWPRAVTIRHGHLNLAGTGFTALPPGVRQVGQLDLRDCPGVTNLPAGLEVASWVDVGGSGLTRLPHTLQDVRLRWRGVAVTERIAFRPDTLTVGEILNEANAEVRRVMLERVGFEWFFRSADAEVLDQDRDPGGERRLLRVPLPNDEPLVCLSVACPSTGRQYALRVPPAMTTCRQAAAWMAGFDDAADYRPLIET
jgi:hypothetical protein